MKMLKSIPGKALVLATLLIVFAGSILLAHAGREPQVDLHARGSAALTPEATTTGNTGWMMVPRGSLVDAAL